MSAYGITCKECGDVVHGWTKAAAKVAFRTHIETEHANTEREDER